MFKMSIRFGGNKEDQEIRLLEELLIESKKQTAILYDIDKFIKQPRSVTFVFPTLTSNDIKGDGEMADLVLAQGGSAPVELHYVDASGNDLGVVPASDSPSISADQPAELGVSVTGGSGTLTNLNTGNADVDVNLSGSAKGFTTVAVITCQGTGVTTAQPAGVKFVFPSSGAAATAAVKKV